jgi:hypothetical protein
MPNPTGRKLWRWIGGALALVLLAGLIAGYVAIRPYGETGTTYLAKQLCSCVFLTGRSDSSCSAEFQPDINKFRVRIDHAQSRVQASLLIFSSTSAFDPRTGCRIVR